MNDFTERGVKDVGYMDGNKFITVPEMIPELIVPDLTDFKVFFFFKHFVLVIVPDLWFLAEALRVVSHTRNRTVRVHGGRSVQCDLRAENR